MDGELRKKVDAAEKVCDYLTANPPGDEAARKVAEEFRAKTARAKLLMTQQEAGEEAASKMTQHRRGLRREMTRVPLRHLIRISKAVSATHPEASGGLSAGTLGRSDQSFQAGVQVILDEVRTHRALYVEQGMSEGTPEEVEAMFKAYQAASSEANAARRSHTGARAELRTLSRALMRDLAQLDGIMLYQVRNQPELQGAWASARNIAWPAGETRAAAKAKGAEPAA